MITKINDSNFRYMNALKVIKETENNLRFLKSFGAHIDSYGKIIIHEGEETIKRCKELMKHYLN